MGLENYENYDVFEEKRKRGRPVKGESKNNQCLVKMSDKEFHYLDMLSDDLELSKPEVIRRALKDYFTNYYC